MRLALLDGVPIVRLARDAAQFEPCAPAVDLGLEAEQSVLGALLVDGIAIERVKGLLPEHFGRVDHRLIYQAILDEREDSGVIDATTISERLRRNGAAEDGRVAYLAALAQNTPSAANVRRYAELVRGHAVRRALAELGEQLRDRALHQGDLGELRSDAKARLEAIEALRDDADAWPEPLDLAALAEREPERPRHILEPWLPAAEVTLLAGHGGSGKSIVALYTGSCIALGKPWHGVRTEQRRVLYISAEDRADVVHWRMSRICAHLGVALGDLAGSLRVIDASHIDAELMIETPHDEPILTARYEALAELMRDAQVLILDGASDLYGASEIVRRHVRRYIRALRRLIPADGAVLLLAHLDKAAARDSSVSDRYSGSTAWHNSVRSRWALGAEPDGDAIVLTLAKANHAGAGAEIRLRWDAEAHLYLPAADRGGIGDAIRERLEREGILTAMRACAAAGITIPAAMQGPRTAYHVLRARPELPASLRSGRDAIRRFRARLEELRQIREFEEREIRRGNRHYTLVLALTNRETVQNVPDSAQ